jgi:hypothetical protein
LIACLSFSSTFVCSVWWTHGTIADTFQRDSFAKYRNVISFQNITLLRDCFDALLFKIPDFRDWLYLLQSTQYFKGNARTFLPKDWGGRRGERGMIKQWESWKKEKNETANELPSYDAFGKRDSLGATLCPLSTEPNLRKLELERVFCHVFATLIRQFRWLSRECSTLRSIEIVDAPQQLQSIAVEAEKNWKTLIVFRWYYITNYVSHHAHIIIYFSLTHLILHLFHVFIAWFQRIISRQIARRSMRFNFNGLHWLLKLLIATSATFALCLQNHRPEIP